jgi:hypothetical protein
LQVISFEDHVAQELDRVSFVPQRRVLRWTTAVLALLSLLAIVAAVVAQRGWWLSLTLGALALASGSALAFYEQSYQRRSGRRGQLKAGLRGQRFLAKVLIPLDDGYYLINSLKLPGRSDDVDHMVIGPNGVFALEAKHHRGRIFWRDGQWYQSKISRRGVPQPETPIRDPTRQLKRNIDYLRSCINGTDLELSRRTRLWIEGAVVFTHPAVSLDLPEEVLDRLPFPVLRARDLPAFILGHKPRRTHTKAEIRQMVSLLGHLHPPSAKNA